LSFQDIARLGTEGVIAHLDTEPVDSKRAEVARRNPPPRPMVTEVVKTEQSDGYAGECKLAIELAVVVRSCPTEERKSVFAFNE